MRRFIELTENFRDAKMIQVREKTVKLIFHFYAHFLLIISPLFRLVLFLMDFEWSHSCMPIIIYQLATVFNLYRSFISRKVRIETSIEIMSFVVIHSFGS